MMLTTGGPVLVYAACLVMALTGWAIAAVLLRGR
jgi:hypothetical protein